MREHDITVHGVRIRYAEEGSGDPPYILIHGLGSGAAKFYDTLPHLAAHRRAIALDLPGFGRSDAPRRAPYSPQWQAGGVRAFLDELGIERATIVGNSYGGLVAMYLAAAWPERCASLVLVSPALPNDGPPSPDAWFFVAGTLPFAGSVMQAYYWKRDPAEVVAESLTRNCVQPSRVSAMTVHMLQQDAARKAADAAYRRASLAAQRATLWAVTGRREITWRVLSSLKVPTVFVWGEDDRVVPMHVGRAAIDRLPGAHLLTIEDCGHNPQMEKPEEFARAVIAFARASDAELPA